ncbi:MAG: hypothetical protein A3K30_03240 [Deltaproteobacteria bacterium RBG_13_51_10]|nr:MAG: hypothetical protein A3K30_03240 [Deltaproteobacteria bacterium RBG_13_51_10]
MEGRLAAFGGRRERDPIPINYLPLIYKEGFCARQIIDALIESHLDSFIFQGISSSCRIKRFRRDFGKKRKG